jgi:hypothetical protein
VRISACYLFDCAFPPLHFSACISVYVPFSEYLCLCLSMRLSGLPVGVHLGALGPPPPPPRFYLRLLNVFRNEIVWTRTETTCDGFNKGRNFHQNCVRPIKYDQFYSFTNRVACILARTCMRLIAPVFCSSFSLIASFDRLCSHILYYQFPYEVPAPLSVEMKVTAIHPVSLHFTP